MKYSPDRKSLHTHTILKRLEAYSRHKTKIAVVAPRSLYKFGFTAMAFIGSHE